ncbi:MAG: Holliday junction resolvase RuvX [Phycisphaerales bacterium]|nr:Holliday junction resolvase RuvX [Phycisphaerales bacterium]MCI0629051.1 Holliday junction resolvase RuvX [Phycisphaerales bacterium]MCI0676874.1 Holliday junction resolvase RuvX [Phycisphaerales bacterium]
MRYLCIDLGQKRTGLALGDDQTKLVSPLDILEIPPGDRLIEALLKTIDQQRPNALVLGLPINMDNTEGPAAKAVRDFGRQLQQHAKLPVHYQDERLTSYAADQHMARSGRTYKKKKQLRDALAAAEILSDFLDARD